MWKDLCTGRHFENDARDGTDRPRGSVKRQTVEIPRNAKIRLGRGFAIFEIVGHGACNENVKAEGDPQYDCKGGR